MKLFLLEHYGQGLFLNAMKREIVEEINEKFPNNFLPKMIDLEISSKLPMGKIAWQCGAHIVIHPKALADRKYARYVLMHELIHAAFQDHCSESAHHYGFVVMADELGLPVKYRD